MKKNCLTILLMLSFFGGMAQKIVLPLPLDSGKSVSGNTLCYMIPTTALHVTVTVSKVQEMTGCYAEYAESLLGLKQVITNDRTYYTLQGVQIETVTVPDTLHSYLVCLGGSQAKQELLKSHTNNLQQAFSTTPMEYTTKKSVVPGFFKNYPNPSFTETEDAFVETKIIDGVVTQVPANRTKKVTRNNNQKAQEAADMIQKSRHAQFGLVSGEQEVPYTAEAIERMLNELKQWEDNYMHLFTGITLEDEIVYSFYVVPESLEPVQLFEFDAENGVRSASGNSNSATCYTLSFRPLMQTSSTEQQLSAHKKAKPSTGYRYRNPMPVEVTLLNQSSTIHNFGILDMLQGDSIKTLPAGQKNLSIDQFGFVF